MNDAASTGKTVPIYKNPFAIAFVIGVITLTFLRPRMRNVPDAPPPSGTIPVSALIDQSGAPFSDAGWPDVTLVGFVEPGGQDCGATNLLSKLWHMYRQEDFDAQVALISLSQADDKALRRLETAAGGAREGWLVLGPSEHSGAAELEAALSGYLAEWMPIRESMRRPRPPVTLEPGAECEGHELLEWVALVDSEGQTRGFYRVSDWEVESELFHRTHRMLPQD